MILLKEISEIAAKKGVVKSTIDKDWALGHFIDAMFTLPDLRRNLVFKGGTCLKKCYFPDYRFSEDLDFTSVDSEFRLTNKHLIEISAFLMDRVQMQTHLESLRNLVYNDRLTGYEATIKFWGSDHPRNETPPPPARWLTKIKIEIILYEIMAFPVIPKNVIHPYSDRLTENAHGIPCYSIEEVLAEKMRALVQRSYTAPRDFYDLWYLTTQNINLNYTEIVKAFHTKMNFKGHSYTGIEQLINPENDKKLTGAWKNSLSHQIPGELPTYENVKTVLLELFTKILA